MLKARLGDAETLKRQLIDRYLFLGPKNAVKYGPELGDTTRAAHDCGDEDVSQADCFISLIATMCSAECNGYMTLFSKTINNHSKRIQTSVAQAKFTKSFRDQVFRNDGSWKQHRQRLDGLPAAPYGKAIEDTCRLRGRQQLSLMN